MKNYRENKMKLTPNQKIALNDLKNITDVNKPLTSQGASIIITFLCDLNANNKDLQNKLSKRNRKIKDLKADSKARSEHEQDLIEHIAYLNKEKK